MLTRQRRPAPWQERAADGGASGSRRAFLPAALRIAPRDATHMYRGAMAPGSARPRDRPLHAMAVLCRGAAVTGPRHRTGDRPKVARPIPASSRAEDAAVLRERRGVQRWPRITSAVVGRGAS
eukprot:364746-Chlamydomonas_euryale.AAC.8